MQVFIKRVYEAPESDDGLRVLVDRLWPRGLSKDAAKVDVWLKSIAPSSELRKWFQHDPEKWPAFKKSYFKELDANPDAVNELLGYINDGKVTLLYSAKATALNNAEALRGYLNRVKR